MRGLLSYDRGPVVALGSCFSDNISRRLGDDLFEVTANPTGTLYNPRSILDAVERIADGRHYTASDLFLAPSGLWTALSHHSDYSDDDPDRLLKKMNDSLDRAHAALQRASLLFVTLGTAFTYSLGDRVVANCHKLPGRMFTRTMMSVDEVAFSLRRIADLCPQSRLVTTVSPIRHTADGLHGNNLSKATLLLGIERSEAAYFPAYEAVIDDLRDYRFYAADMKHPSEVAADYVYELLCDSLMDSATITMRDDLRGLSRLMSHRPKDSDRHRALIEETADKLAKKYPSYKEKIKAFLNDNGLHSR